MTSLVKGPVRIIGVGLIGGSLGLALRASGVEVQLEDHSSATAALAADLGIGKIVTNASSQPDLVIVAAPPAVCGELVFDALQRFPNATICDVASVKSQVLADLSALAERNNVDISRYVGAHPMAGRELSGVVMARGDLFRGRPFVAVPHGLTDSTALAKVRALGVEVGGIVSIMEAPLHDAAVALVSHLPQLMSTLVAARLRDAPDGSLDLAGQGLRDVTRIANSPAQLWTEIFAANSNALLPLLRELRGDLDTVITAMEHTPQVNRAPLARTMVAGNLGLARVPGKHGGSAAQYQDVVVLIPDEPGALAQLLTDIGEARINIEDMRLEHSYGQPMGLVHLFVAIGMREVLERELKTKGWQLAAHA